MKKTISALLAVCMLVMSMGISVFAQEDVTYAEVSTFEEFKEAVEDPAVETIRMMNHIQFTEPLTLTKNIVIGTWEPEAYMIKAHDDGPMFRVVGDDITIRFIRNFESQVLAFAPENMGGYGSFVSADVNHLTIQNAHLSSFDNMVYMENGDVTLSNCLCYDNTAYSGLYWGPVVYSESGNVEIEGSRIHDNVSMDAAGAIYVANGDVKISRSTIEDNRAFHYGGAVYVRNGNVTVENQSVITNNQATAGAGGIHVEYGTVAIDNTSSVTGNSGPGGDVVVEHIVF